MVTELNTVVCYVTGALIFIEMKRRNEVTNNSKYHLNLGATESCIKSMMESTKGLCHRNIKGAIKDCFIFDSWVASKRSAKLRYISVKKLLEWIKLTGKDSSRITSRM